MAALTNTKASQALRGEGVKVTLSLTDFEEFLSNPLTQIGAVMVTDGGALGTIHSIDEFGNSFIIVPLMSNESFSDIPGYLTEGATVDFD